jgi:hypothetical protein
VPVSVNQLCEGKHHRGEIESTGILEKKKSSHEPAMMFNKID